ncbi:MAG: hypothetical protein NT120_01775 [Candidatus Aenigmarchaeota archaeon]|nr:hypothetical protein [Candidatus Aenigmarchaeota archaeon]
MKKIRSNSATARLLSKAFEHVVKEKTPVNTDYIELDIPGSTYIKNGNVYLGVSYSDLIDKDLRTAKIIIRFEMFRAFVKKVIDRDIPRDIEDLIVAREMIKRGLIEDVVYLFYTYVMKNAVFDIRSLMKFYTIPAMFLADGSYENLFYDIAEKKAGKKSKPPKKFLTSIYKDLTDEKNLEKAIKIYEEMLDAGY